MPGYPSPSLSCRSGKGVPESCLQPVAWYRWWREVFHRLVALNSVKVTSSCSRYPEVRLYSSSGPWKYVLKVAGLLSPAEKHLSALF